MTRNPLKIEVEMSEKADAETTINLHGKIAGMGPHQKRHVTAEVGKLRNAIEVAVYRAEKSPGEARHAKG